MITNKYMHRLDTRAIAHIHAHARTPGVVGCNISRWLGNATQCKTRNMHAWMCARLKRKKGRVCDRGDVGTSGQQANSGRKAMRWIAGEFGGNLQRPASRKPVCGRRSRCYVRARPCIDGKVEVACS